MRRQMVTTMYNNGSNLYLSLSVRCRISYCMVVISQLGVLHATDGLAFLNSCIIPMV